MRIGVSYDSFTLSTGILIYNLEEKKWKDAWKFKDSEDESTVIPMGFGKDPNTLYVRADNEEKNAIFKVDISKPDLPMELVAKDDKYDINGSLIYSKKTRDVVGVRHGEAEGERIYWDEEFKNFQAAIDKALPDTVNHINHDPEKICPAIIFPHGGPMARDYGDFDYWAEFFAHKGIMVLQPNFRGSSGYGRKFKNEAIQNFGLVMQDDLTDAATWLIEQKMADPTRIAIGGGSYGGYAALMGAVKTPDLYRCAISFAGISDLQMILKGSQNFMNYGAVRKQIGTDKEKLKATSPIFHVDKIKIPILLAHGDADRTVSVEQSREMSKKLEEQKKVYKYLEFQNGDHSLTLQKHRNEFFKAMDEFLDKYLLDNM